MASPLAAAAGFHCLPALAAAWEHGNRSRINLLLAGRSQARAPSSPGPTRGAVPFPRFGGSERCGDSTAPGSVGAGREGIEESLALGASLSAVSPAQEGQGLRVLPGCGSASWRLQSLGAARDSASLQRAPRLPGWSSHLWESLALGLWLLSLIRNPTEGVVSLSGAGRCSKPARGHPSAFASCPRGLAPASQPAAGRCFPFTARPPQ